MIEMLGIDVGDDGHISRELQEGAVGLVRLHHHPLAIAHAGIGAVGIDDAAVDDGRIEPARIEQRGDEGRRGGLAMGAGKTTTTQDLKRMSSASISARRTTGRRFSRATINSGLLRLIAVETTTISASSTFSALWPMKVLMPLSFRRLTL
jgi:hypothetical protein